MSTNEAAEPRFRLYTLAELRAMPPESRERAYRRGYADGWVQGIGAMWDLMFGRRLTRKAAYQAAWDFWQDELGAWRRQAPKDRLILPPGLDVKR